VLAVRLHDDGLKVEEIETPSPDPGEVLVRVHAAAITRGELEWPVDRLPAIPSYELSGVVVGSGDEVYALTPFDRDGVAAEYAVVPADVLAPKPLRLSHVEAAALPMGGLTAWQALFVHGRLARGERVLVTGAGLMLRSFLQAQDVDLGYQPKGLLFLHLDAPTGQGGEPAALYDEALARIRAIPGVKGAGFTSALPLTWKGGSSGFTMENRVLPPGLVNDANNRVVTPGYFESMRIPIVKGRAFDERDGSKAPLVAMINETMAKRFWQNPNPVGLRFKFNDSPWIQIVGIVGDVKQMGLNEPTRQEMYFPYWQGEHNWMVPRDLTIRTAGDPMALLGSVKQTIASIDQDQPISDIKTMDQWLDEEVASRQVQTTLLGGFAALALILACIGIYGVLAYIVTQRTQEIGLRVALGADSTNIFLDVARQGMGLTGIGIALGLTLSLVLSRLLQKLLFDVKPTDPMTYLAASAIFALVALLACYIPARRASRVDPLVALRYE